MEARGDLSNAIVPRWVITLDALTQGFPVPPKKRLKSWDWVAAQTPIDLMQVGRLWQFSLRVGVRWELAVFGQPFEYAEALEKYLDRTGVSPVVWVVNYKNRLAFQQALAYRPDIVTVVDERGHAHMWGAKGVAMEDLIHIG